MKKLEFGTAGIRGILGPEEEFLNEVHIFRIINGLAKYLLANFSNVKSRGVVIGRDNRRQSKNFSEISAMILTSYEIKVHYNEQIVPTPFISYATRKLNAVGAINITASHNPKEYNGVKLYDENGCQLLPQSTKKLLTYFEKYDNHLQDKIVYQPNKYFNFITPKLMDDYLSEAIIVGGELNDLSNIRIAYTPQHGTGANPVKKIFDTLKVNSFYEENEMIEDTEFTYSENPNPEIHTSFNNVLEVAHKNNCDLVLVTDPDADRVGAAIKNNHDYQIITGNETAILIFNYLINQLDKSELSKRYLIYSFVSSSLPKKMAQENGLNYYITETGFKWIGNLVEELSHKQSDQKFLFAFEESYGSLIDEKICRDKDAIQSIVILAKMASYYQKQNKTLIDILNDIYQKYGFVKSGAIIINLQSNDHLKNLKKSFANLKIPNTSFFDYNLGIRGIEPNDMLSYEFSDDSWISLRPSGTEPKIKIYLFFIDQDKEIAEKKYHQYFEVLNKL